MGIVPLPTRPGGDACSSVVRSKGDAGLVPGLGDAGLSPRAQP